MKHQCIHVGLFIIFLSIILTCHKKPQHPVPEDALVVNGSSYIMPRDLQYRLEFTPHRPLKHLSDSQRKEAYLKPLIDEMLLAEQTTLMDLDTNRMYQQKISEIKKDILREELYTKEVKEKIPIPEKVYQTAMKRAQEQLTLDYVTFDTRNQAEFAEEQLKSGDAQFTDLVTLAYKAGIAPPRIQVTGGQLKPEVEDQIFNLDTGEVTPIIKTGDGFTLMKLVHKQSIPITDTDKYEKKMQQVRKSVEDKYLNAASRQYVLGVMKDVDARINPDGFSVITSFLRAHPRPAKTDTSIATLPPSEINKTGALTEKQLDHSLVNFDGNIWTARDFFRIALARGTTWPDSTASVPYWVKNTLGGYIRDEVLAQKAYAENLDTSTVVRQRFNRWDNYFRARLYLQHLHTKYQSDSIYTRKLRDVLDSLHNTNSPRIDYNQLKDLQINNTEMIVMKRGSYSRTAVPPYPGDLLNVEFPPPDSAR